MKAALQLDARVGRVVADKWRLDAELRADAVSSFYAATHVRNARRVALKILNEHWVTDDKRRARFMREGVLVNAIAHPGVVRVLDDGITEEGAPYLVTELFEGKSLESCRRAFGGKLRVVEVIQASLGLLDVLAAVHRAGVVHRDVKPSNVLVTKHGSVRLLDFGVAFSRRTGHPPEDHALERSAGTPAFMPPEMAFGGRAHVDARSDLWSVGATMFTLLSGQLVHRSATLSQVALAATKRARSLHEIAPQVPRGLVAVIDRALAFDKTRRWENAETMREALRWAGLSMR